MTKMKGPESDVKEPSLQGDSDSMGRLEEQTADAAKLSEDESSAPSGIKYELQVLVSLRRIIRALDLYSRKLKSVYGLTVPQLVCLSTLSKEGPMSSVELSSRVQLSPSTLVGILDRLQKMELISRERSVSDRRIVLVRASARGGEMVSRAPSPLQDTLTDALKNLPIAEQETITRSLARVVDLMQAQDITVAPILTLDKVDYSMDGKSTRRDLS